MLAPPSLRDPAPGNTPGHTAPAHIAAAVVDNVAHVIAGRRAQLDVAVACLLAGGHLLIEDIPGVGKTLFAQSFAHAVGGSFRRVQGTSDLLPADIVGGLTPQPDGMGLMFRPGPVFANVVVVDELNRTSQRTQSALLEALEEQRVTVDGVTYSLPDPWFVVATQNPVDLIGTAALGDGVLDRFMAVISLGRADDAEELDVLTGRRGRPQLDAAESGVCSPAGIEQARRAVVSVHVADEIGRYGVAVLNAIRRHPGVQGPGAVGPSTRAGVSMMQLAKAFGAIRGRDFVSPDDVMDAAHQALAHRLGAGVDRTIARQLVRECVHSVPAPRR